jgi:hypothetical protein
MNRTCKRMKTCFPTSVDPENNWLECFECLLGDEMDFQRLQIRPTEERGMLEIVEVKDEMDEI